MQLFPQRQHIDGPKKCQKRRWGNAFGGRRPAQNQNLSNNIVRLPSSAGPDLFVRTPPRQRKYWPSLGGPAYQRQQEAGSVQIARERRKTTARSDSRNSGKNADPTGCRSCETDKNGGILYRSRSKRSGLGQRGGQGAGKSSAPSRTGEDCTHVPDGCRWIRAKRRGRQSAELHESSGNTQGPQAPSTPARGRPGDCTESPQFWRRFFGMHWPPSFQIPTTHTERLLPGGPSRLGELRAGLIGRLHRQ